MENVPGILTIDDGSVVDAISRTRLRELGYDVARRVLSAEQFGTPQLRRRCSSSRAVDAPAEDLLPELGARLRRPATAGAHDDEEPQAEEAQHFGLERDRRLCPHFQTVAGSNKVSAS